MKKHALALALALATAGAPATALAGNSNIKIVGSSTVYPFSTVAAERFSQIEGYAAPTVESTGSGGGIKLFCAGVGAGTPDIVNASRQMKKSERKKCEENGVDVLEVKIGYDGIVFAQSLAGEELKLSNEEIFSALRREIQKNDDSNPIPNTIKTWNQIENSNLPDIAIRVYGPPPTSGTRDAFAELALEKGCASFLDPKDLKESDKKSYKAVCHSVREDGVYIESGENDNIIIQKLVAAPNAIGIFGYSFLEENRDKVRGIEIDGVAPNFESIADGAYPLSRPLFFYVKKNHYDETQTLKAFADFFVKYEVMGEDGFLADRGLIPLPELEREKIENAVIKSFKNDDL